MNLVEVFKRYKLYFAELLVLSFPLIIGNLGQALISLTNVFVAAKYSINALASIAIANSIIFTIFIIGMGLLAGISINLANYRGRRLYTKKYYNISLLYSLGLSIIFAGVTAFMIPFIDNLGFQADLVPFIKQYMKISIFSFPGIYLYQAIREFLQAHEIVMFPNIVLFSAVFINLLFNFWFVFGFGIIPSMGVKGLAIATLLVRSIMGLVMFVYCFGLMKSNKQIIERKYIIQLIKIGCPIGVSLLVEFLAFNLITILVGRIDGALSATHNIILNITGLTFMVPLALSNALSIKVGYYNGAQNYTEIKRYSIVGVSVALVFMMIMSFVLFNFPAQIIKIFTQDNNILHIAVPIIMVAAIYQMFDGLQVSVGGILKGLKMTKTVSVCVFIGYWVMGLPLGCLLAFKYHFTLLGFWIGLAISLFTISIIFLCIILMKFKDLKERYFVDLI